MDLVYPYWHVMGIARNYPSLAEAMEARRLLCSRSDILVYWKDTRDGMILYRKVA